MLSLSAISRARIGVVFLLALGVAGSSARAGHDGAAKTPNRVLYLFAHQDDEIFVLAKMRQDLDAGRDVFAVWITDGAKDGKPQAREKESRAVMARVGVPAENLTFLGFPDHDSIEYLEPVFERLVELQAGIGAVEVTSPAYEGGNIDHDVAALMGSALVRSSESGIAHYEFPLYNAQHGRRRIGVFLTNSPEPITYITLKGGADKLVLDALKLYRSQRILLTMLELTGHKKMLIERGEPSRKAADYDFLQRPANERCGYEIFGLHKATFAEWHDAVNTFLNDKTTTFEQRADEVIAAKKKSHLSR